MSRESRSKENRARILRIIAYLSPFDPIEASEVEAAAQDPDVIEEVIHNEDDEEILVDSDAFNRLIQAGVLRRTSESPPAYELTEQARTHHVDTFIEAKHDVDDVRPDIKQMDMKQVRARAPSGFMYLFAHPEMPYIIDALLDSTPSTTMTKERLAEQAGVTTRTVERCLPKLVEVGLLRECDDGTYEVWSDTNVYRHLTRLNAEVNATASIDAQAALANREKLPEQRHSHFCEECGARGIYDGATPFGAVLACPEGHGEWITGATGSPEKTLRMEMMTEIDDEDIERIRETAPDERSDREQAILDLHERSNN